MTGGSSPLARGKCRRAGLAGRRRGFIPTRAGKMPRRPRGYGATRVHPHSRGENLPPQGTTGAAQGSSPLARGKSAGRQAGAAGDGFIPTRAGKIMASLTLANRAGVHPHSRGENRPSSATWRQAWGSSPLARGKYPRNAWHKLLGGFIPTRAGKITWQALGDCPWPVHPHSRGENTHDGGRR